MRDRQNWSESHKLFSCTFTVNTIQLEQQEMKLSFYILFFIFIFFIGICAQEQDHDCSVCCYPNSSGENACEVSCESDECKKYLSLTTTTLKPLNGGFSLEVRFLTNFPPRNPCKNGFVLDVKRKNKKCIKIK